VGRGGPAVMVSVLLLSAACGGGESAAPVAGPPPSADTSASRAGERAAAPPPPPIAYEARDRRDPFRPPAPAAQEAPVKPRAPVEGFRLVGVISRSHGTMALIEAPDGTSHIVGPGDVLDGARVLQVSADAVRLAVVGARDGNRAEVTLRLQPH
jgi:Tfp pilus assembly protein PilP